MPCNQNAISTRPIAEMPEWIERYVAAGVAPDGIRRHGRLHAISKAISRRRRLSNCSPVAELLPEGQAGLKRVILADTMGWGTPKRTRALFEASATVGRRSSSRCISDTRGTAMSNTIAAMGSAFANSIPPSAEARGCPFAGHKGAARNVSTEDRVHVQRDGDRDGYRPRSAACRHRTRGTPDPGIPYPARSTPAEHEPASPKPRQHKAAIIILGGLRMPVAGGARDRNANLGRTTLAVSDAMLDRISRHHATRPQAFSRGHAGAGAIAAFRHARQARNGRSVPELSDARGPDRTCAPSRVSSSPAPSTPARR